MPAMNPQLKQRRTLDAILRLILRESINQPVMLIVEDLQWIDQQTHALLNLLVDSIAASRVLMLVNYRPEYINPWAISATICRYVSIRWPRIVPNGCWTSC